MAPTTKIPTKDDNQKKNKVWTLNLRTLALAQPNRFKISEKYSPPLPPKFYVKKYALKAKTTPRTIALAKTVQYKQTKKFDPLKHRAPLPIPVSTAALKAKCSPRNEMLARNVLMKMLAAYEMYKDRGDYFQYTMIKYINLAKASMYREMYWPKPPPPPEDPPKLKSCQYKKYTPCPKPKSKAEARAELMEWCKTRSVPKAIFPPEPLPRSRKRPSEAMKKRLAVLAMAKHTTKKYNAVEADRYTTGVSKSALSYQSSERMKELAQPKPIKNPKSNPTGVKRSALTATASPRTGELAKPRERSQGLNEEKENPYSVKPKALKAYCSERTKELAKPKQKK